MKLSIQYALVTNYHYWDINYYDFWEKEDRGANGGEQEC